MSLVFTYSLRHLLTRKTTAFLTVIGIALVVFVFVATLMLSQGLKETLAGTGSSENVIVVRSGAQNEMMSGIAREAANALLAEPEVARVGDQPLATSDSVVLVSLKKRGSAEPSNVTIRGVGEQALSVRPQVRLTAGRNFTPGSREVLVGKAIHDGFSGTEIGQKIRLFGTEWEVVGLFDGGRSAFNSEIWGDVNAFMPTFKRDQFSSLLFKLAPGVDFAKLKPRLENDKRYQVSVMRENDFYAAQSDFLATFIRIIGGFISVVFSLGAVIGAMITMYAAVASRVREIGILRAIGFRRRAVFVAFVLECLMISLVGGVLGVALASLMSFVAFSTTNFSTFAEVAFDFTLTPSIVVWGLGFSLLMGLVGGALPARAASRLKVLDAIRQAG